MTHRSLGRGIPRGRIELAVLALIIAGSVGTSRAQAQGPDCTMTCTYFTVSPESLTVKVAPDGKVTSNSTMVPSVPPIPGVTVDVAHGGMGVWVWLTVNHIDHRGDNNGVNGSCEKIYKVRVNTFLDDVEKTVAEPNASPTGEGVCTITNLRIPIEVVSPTEIHKCIPRMFKHIGVDLMSHNVFGALTLDDPSARQGGISPVLTCELGVTVSSLSVAPTSYNGACPVSTVVAHASFQSNGAGNLTTTWKYPNGTSETHMVPVRDGANTISSPPRSITATEHGSVTFTVMSPGANLTGTAPYNVDCTTQVSPVPVKAPTTARPIRAVPIKP